MQYLGGKAKIARHITAAVLSHVPENQRSKYFEPFTGGCNTFCLTAPYFKSSLGMDAHEDLILMWQEIMRGWEPPDELAREEYYQLKDQEPSALRAFAGFGCSFGGKWFGGYASHSPGHFTVAGSKSAILKQAAIMKGHDSTFRQGVFGSVTPDTGTVVYCDPPYAGTHKYVMHFDYDSFWTTCQGWADSGAKVFVSEYKCPEDVKADLIWSGVRRKSLNDKTAFATENLYVLK